MPKSTKSSERLAGIDESAPSLTREISVGAAGSREGDFEDESFVPEPRPKAITLKLVMSNSLSVADFTEYEGLDTEQTLSRAQGLKTLHLEWLNIGEISNLEMFDSAEVVYLQHNKIERIEGLESMPKLQFLALQSNSIQLVENLLELPCLEFLDLSKNRMSTLDENELPQTINMINFVDNPCVEQPGYRKRILARLPDLAVFDGEDLEESGTGVAESPVEDSDAIIGGAVRGLSAYYQRGAMQKEVSNQIRDEIEAYEIEALGDVDGFCSKMDAALERSKQRQDGFEQSLDALRLNRSAEASELPSLREDATAIMNALPPPQPQPPPAG